MRKKSDEIGVVGRVPLLGVLVPPPLSTCLCDTGDSYKGNLEPGEAGEKASDKNMRNLLIIINKFNSLLINCSRTFVD